MTAAVRPVVAGARGPVPSLHDALAVLGAALVLGLCGDLLFKGVPLGINLFAWVAGLCAWATFLARNHTLVRPSPDAWQAPAVLLAALFALRGGEALRALDLLAVLAALALPVVRAQGHELAQAGVTAFGRALVALGLHLPFGGLLLVAKDTTWGEITGNETARQTGRAVVAALVAGPIVVLFAALFASADPVFNGMVTSLLSFNLEPLAQHGVIIGLCGAFAAGYLRLRLWGAHRFPRVDVPVVRLDSVAILSGVGGMALVFLLFVAIQARALFGGSAFVQATTGLTLAEYARKGFFECVWAAGLSLPLLSLAHAVLDPADQRARRSLAALASLQLALIGVVLASAASRLLLYTQAFGLTEDRLFGLAALVWLVWSCGCFAVTALRGRSGFVFGALAGGMATLALLNVANPAAIVARVNIDRVAAGYALDVPYLQQLGIDAVPAIVARLDRVQPSQGCALKAHVLKLRAALPTSDARSFSYARYAARRAAAQAERYQCPAVEATTTGA